jgi:AmmeMemoRadiSam system protein B/AmmeMemoRadiSam system protein A
MKTLLALTLSAVLFSACAAPSLQPPQARATQPAPSPPPAATVPPDKVRPAAFAGTWYPGDPDTLRQTVDKMLADAQPFDGDPVALIAPHAGYVYSGPVAAYSFRQLEGKAYDTAIIIAPDHQAPVSRPISVWAEGGLATPLGVVPVDADLAQALIAADSRITFDRAAYADEHAVEIELPFLQRACPACRVVPVLMGADDDATVQALADALLKVLPGRGAVVIASSDLSHYPKREDAQRIDAATLAAIQTGDPAAVRAAIATAIASGVPNLATCACGDGPILVAMRVARGLGADKVTRLHYANSADSPQGDPSQVVGYGAVMFSRSQPSDLTEAQRTELTEAQRAELTEAQRAELLKLARAAIAEEFRSGSLPAYQTDNPALNRHAGVFVTLTENEELRGCIGRIQADETPLYRTVQEMAVASAISDPRFPPLAPDELSRVSIEISILSPMRRITDVQEIVVGTHGVMLVEAGQQGVFLPQVPVEQGWNRDQYLENLCLKAGLPTGCMNANPELYTFTTLVFGEENPPVGESK